MATKGEMILGCLVGWMDRCDSLLKAEVRELVAGPEIARKLKLYTVNVVSDSVGAVWSVKSGMWNGLDGVNLVQDARLDDVKAKLARSDKWSRGQADAIPRRMGEVTHMVHSRE